MAGEKRAKRQAFRRKQQRQVARALQRDLEKLSKKHCRELTRAVKKAKTFELAKNARKVKSAAGQGKETSVLIERQTVLKSIAVSDGLAAAIKHYELQALLQERPATTKAVHMPKNDAPSEGRALETLQQGSTLHMLEKLITSNAVKTAATDAAAALREHTLDEEDAKSQLQGRAKEGAMAAKRPPDDNGTSSVFLSSLDTDDAEQYAGAGARKNRRGQKARQKLAEKRYGQNAKHLVKARRKEQELAAARAAAAAAVAERTQVPINDQSCETQTLNRRERRKRERLARLQAAGNSIAAGDSQKEKSESQPASSVDSRDVHPSWAAKHAQKRVQEAAAAAAASKRTKIVFED